MATKTPKLPRKRKRSITPGNWKRTLEKINLYSSPGDPIRPLCGHRRSYRCALLTPTDIDNFHRAFYIKPSKQEQEAFLLKFCKTNSPKRLRVEENDRKKSREFMIEYSVVNQVGIKLPVCKKTFLGILRITKQRVLSVFQKFKKEGALVPMETRGGNRKDNFRKKQESVKSFISKLKTTESHYGRAKSVRRYLSSEMSISKLSKLYNDNVAPELKVKESYFRYIFVTCFNISFSAPAVDECSYCLEMTERIKMAKDDKEKEALSVQKSSHVRLARSFYTHLQKKPDDCLLLSFDCQKNLPLPKVTDQQAYYSRQLYCYNLSVVKGISTASLSPENVSIYTWTENESKKSSNEVGSIIINELQAQDMTDYTNIRLVCDGCPGQNKNVNVLAACAKWLYTEAPKNIVSIELVYPVTGHSFLPSDRVFGLIEKQLKKMPTIVHVREYHEVFRQFGTVKFLGEDWCVYDWRTEAQTNVKTAAQLHFQIQKCKKIILRKTKQKNILVRGEVNYSGNSVPEKSILKPKIETFNMPPKRLALGTLVKAKKLEDVRGLLKKHFGENWAELESLQWYVTVFNNNDRIAIDNPQTEENADENNNENSSGSGDDESDDEYYECECFEFYDDDEDAILPNI